jgi:hypothetical protein
MRAYTYDKNNPLVRFYDQLDTGGKRVNKWRLVSEMTGMPVQTVISVARRDYKGVLRMNLATYLQIKDTINVDMLSFGQEDHQETPERTT